MYLLSGSSQDVVVAVPAGVASVSYTVLGHDGSTLATGSVTPGAQATSVTITVGAAHNTLSGGPVWERRRVSWQFTAPNSGTVLGRYLYKVEAGVEHDATPEMVRALLGVEDHELPDADIDLTAAYFQFRELVDATTMDAAMLETGWRPLAISRSIAAQAGLNLLHSLRIRLANSESSGTNEFKRQTIDFEALREALGGVIADGMGALTPGGFTGTPIFDVATRTDAVTGS